MSVPSRPESVALLLSLDPPPWHLRHSRAVAETAAWLARRAASAGVNVDRRLVEAAALLHDVDKLATVEPEVAGLRHADGSAAWLERHGHAELAPLVLGHPVTRLADAAWFEEWFPSALPEALIVAYADKRAGQRVETMAQRFASWRRRYPPAEQTARAHGSWTEATLAGVWKRAEALELRVCSLAACSPAEVRRLPWTGPLVRAARSELPPRRVAKGGLPPRRGGARERQVRASGSWLRVRGDGGNALVRVVRTGRP